MLSANEIQKFSRHLKLPDFGVAEQQKLKEAKILVVGAGGLGSPVLQYLTASGVGTIGIVEFDKIEISNLQRQILYKEGDVGAAKIQKAAESIQKQNPSLNLHLHELQLQNENAIEIISQYDLVIDGSDNFPTRYLVNDACVLSDKPLVYGSVYRYEGQVAVFNVLLENGLRSCNYRDLFPEPPPPELAPNCAEGGVLGVLPGVIGCLQVNEAIKVITGVGEALVNKILIVDLQELLFRSLVIKKNDGIKIEELIDYEQFCNHSLDKADSNNKSMSSEIKEITVQDLKQWRDEGKDFQLIDVRESYEYDVCHLDGELIPLAELVANEPKIAKDKDVVVHCRSGARSAAAINQIQQIYGLDNLYNLKGGILAWSAEIDPSVPQY